MTSLSISLKRSRFNSILKSRQGDYPPLPRDMEPHPGHSVQENARTPVERLYQLGAALIKKWGEMIDRTEDLQEFAFCYDNKYDYLAQLADPEDWGDENRMLKNYC